MHRFVSLTQICPTAKGGGRATVPLGTQRPDGVEPVIMHVTAAPEVNKPGRDVRRRQFPSPWLRRLFPRAAVPRH